MVGSSIIVSQLYTLEPGMVSELRFRSLCRTDAWRQHCDGGVQATPRGLVGRDVQLRGTLMGAHATL